MQINVNSGSFHPDVGVDFGEYLTFTGESWRFASTPISITGPTAYLGLTFRTPPGNNYKSIYRFASYFKTGDELLNALIESPTPGGTQPAFTFTNLDQTSTEVCPFTTLAFGSALTLTGGTTLTTSFVPGLGVGASQMGSAIQSTGFMVLKPDTLYGLKVQALGGATKISIVLNMSSIKIGV